MSRHKGLTPHRFGAHVFPARISVLGRPTKGRGAGTGVVFPPKSHPAPATEGHIRPLKTLLLPFLVKLFVKGFGGRRGQEQGHAFLAPILYHVRVLALEH